MSSKLLTSILTLSIFTALIPTFGTAGEINGLPSSPALSGEEFPESEESLALIQQYDRDYDKWSEHNVSAPVSHAEKVNVVIHKGSQNMVVSVNGAQTFSTMVTTGMKGNATPSGTWHPGRVESVHMSKEFHAPLPWAVEITGGYFIHGATPGALVYMKKKIPHSHGCVRVPPVFARKLFDLVRQAGLSNTTITVAN